jgi:hypothetical protein
MAKPGNLVSFDPLGRRFPPVRCPGRPGRKSILIRQPKSYHCRKEGRWLSPKSSGSTVLAGSEQQLATPSRSSAPERYQLFVREAGAAIVLRYTDAGVWLTGNHIGWTQGGRDKELPLSDIAAIHLTTEVHSFTTNLGASMCRISFKRGVVLNVLSGNSLGNDDAGLTARYRAFVTELHARLGTKERASIEFSAGRGGVLYGLSLLATILLGVCVAVIVVFATAAGSVKPRTLISVFMGFGLVVALFRFLQVNAPHAYDPARPLDSAASGSISGTIDHALRQFRRGLTQGKAVALGATVLVIIAIGVGVVGSQASLSMFGSGRAQHALDLIRQRAGARLVVRDIDVTPQAVTVAVPDPNRDANDTQWVASRGTLFGLTEWDRVSGPERGPSLAVEDEDSMDPFPLEAGDSAGIDKMAKNAIARAALGDGSAVTEMILTQAPQFIHPEAPRWTVRVTSPQRTVTVLADRSGKLFPATVAATGPPRIVIHADSGSWIRVRNVDQSDLYEGVLKAGESYGVPNTPGLILRTGNAGALEITVDGKPVPSIGDGLLARRDVRLDTQALLDGTAVLE